MAGTMDPLSEVLSLVKLGAFVSRGFEAGRDWAVAFPRHDGIKFYAVVAGSCWLSVEGSPEPVRLGAGDCFLLPRGHPFRLASDLALKPIDATQLFPAARDGGVTMHNGGGDFVSVGGYLGLAGEQAPVLLDLLPPIVHIREEAAKAELRWCVERMRQELRDPQPGGFLVAQQLATLMLIQALRLHLAEARGQQPGWLFALGDRQMAAAIGVMHAEPARRWTLQSLAERVGMSRTSFAVKFRETVGAAPMAYLAGWRMLRAADRLAHSSAPVSAIALDLGYESESAFSTAFKRAMGCSPRQYARQRTASSKAA
ncbi:MAG TPA: AraC family transcriptional regulator [Caulobacteraceae bacterium]|nr:AraC family transcriptional regulator [Caulobacteraceae bacterium]